ncbi:YraN family protein [Reinekea sp.]|uniref:YraN family protein n=1 Tax=Reinekea sp. TaxID=1970455 RepID=UPI002A835606|nr:YraN family protein [Reinekea sp.]
MNSGQAEHLRKGVRAEHLAESLLVEAGLTILARNFHSRFGELDRVCRSERELIFVEVRYRAHTRFGSAAASVTPAKQKKLTKAAHYYILTHDHLSKLFMRFDVIGIDSNQQTQWIKGAFLATV